MQARKQGNAQGIDVSHWNGVINWPKVAASGISFAFIKATQNSVDKRFIENVKGAKAAGLLIGAYHYLDERVTTVDAAKAAAKMFYNAIQYAGVKFDLPPVLDYESKSSGLSAAGTTAVAKAFLEEIKRLTGVRPILYTYPAFIGNFSGLSQYPLWIARYSTQTPADVSGWKRWEFWQYSDGQAGGTLPNGSRKVNGINGQVDLNEFDGTEADLRHKYGPKKEEAKVTERDVNQVSPWAADDWAEAKANGYFDGKGPGAPITREQTAIVINRLRSNFLKLIAGNTTRIAELERRLEVIEKGGDLQ
ncbi:glycoside hydrolase family 25 protein [Paenibacillus motobuensis]|uniref:glycoside hydrolase family 25 protein n=1 Tax=Paenibacillus TaxID=44249 RepID=UPI002041B6EA|nr:MULTISPECIES: glycoside hydrolase family 25 protein [Paenibacillus]MCM3041728.1 glycoside hydrolase family 25 protein [Paenibacillus lutimineralis]MCM3648832.1 glycoside hydrolase family 25 protein [Paenibacillus motobuensis]